MKPEQKHTLGKVDMTDEEVLATRDDLAMMQRPHLWPNESVLALKRMKQNSRIPGYDCGVLLNTGEGCWSFIENAYIHDQSTWGQAEHGHGMLLIGLVSAGWIVD